VYLDKKSKKGFSYNYATYFIIDWVVCLTAVTGCIHHSMDVHPGHLRGTQEERKSSPPKHLSVALREMQRNRHMTSLEDVRRIKEAAEPHLLSLPGVQGVSVGYKQVGGKQTGTLAIIVYVEKKQDVPAQDAIPAEVQGIPTDVVEARFTLDSA
jgi:hypothetical protein